MSTPEGRSSCGVCALELGLLVLLGSGEDAVSSASLDATVKDSVELYQQVVTGAGGDVREFVDVKKLCDTVPRYRTALSAFQPAGFGALSGLRRLLEPLLTRSATHSVIGVITKQPETVVVALPTGSEMPYILDSHGFGPLGLRAVYALRFLSVAALAEWLSTVRYPYVPMETETEDIAFNGVQIDYLQLNSGVTRASLPSVVASPFRDGKEVEALTLGASAPVSVLSRVAPDVASALASCGIATLEQLTLLTDDAYALLLSVGLEIAVVRRAVAEAHAAIEVTGGGGEKGGEGSGSAAPPTTATPSEASGK